MLLDTIAFVNSKINSTEWKNDEIDLIKPAFDIPMEYAPDLADIMADFALKLDIVTHLKRHTLSHVSLYKDFIQIFAIDILITTQETEPQSWKTRPISPQWLLLRDEDKKNIIEDLFKENS